MRTQTFISSMVGVSAAVAVAGSAAQAGIVWTNPTDTGLYAPSFNRNNLDNYDTEQSNSITGTGAFLARTRTVGGVTASWTATTTTSGFSVVANSTEASYGVTSWRSFTVTDSPLNVDLTWIGNSGIYLYTQSNGILNQFQGITSSSGSTAITLAAGDYVIIQQMSGTATPSSFNFSVPAPGAAALVGLAGLVATRRRRN
jgi:MYXO-CTERM domain-containing protein